MKHQRLAGLIFETAVWAVAAYVSLPPAERKRAEVWMWHHAAAALRAVAGNVGELAIRAENNYYRAVQS